MEILGVVFINYLFVLFSLSNVTCDITMCVVPESSPPLLDQN